MKTLSTIQKLMKAGKIISLILFIFFICGLFFSIIGMIALGFDVLSLKFGGETLKSIIESSANIGFEQIYSAAASSIVICIGEGILCCLAYKYFTGELTAGTPFDEKSSKQLFNLGLCTIIIPVVMSVIVQIIIVLISKASGFKITFNFELSGSAGVGLLMIVTSLICKHGFEALRNINNTDEADCIQN